MAMMAPVLIGNLPSQLGLLSGFPAMQDDKTAPAFDLQSHSTYSDGALAPADVVRTAAAQGVTLLALTDHDTVDGVPEALEASRQIDVSVVPAAELSAVHGGHEDLHILGYGIDHTDPALLETLRDYRGDRARRIHAMADRLRELGFALDESHLQRETLGRPHLADALLSHPDNAERLRAEGIDGRNALFPKYLVPGAIAYVARSRPTVPEAIALIHAHGGVAVWAHPFWDLDDPEETRATLREFVAHGLDGVEAFYPTHSESQTGLLHAFAREHGLLATGSTDFHGPAHERFNRFRGFPLYGLEPVLGVITQHANG
jgi:predicted metal-dependent phosphoesterase TrpH